MVDTAFDPPLEITKFYPIAEGDCCTSNFYSLCFFCSGCVPSNNMFGHHSCLLRYVLVCPLLLSEQKWKKEYAKSKYVTYMVLTMYRISGNIGNIFNLAVWQSGSKLPNFYHQIYINLLTTLCPCCATAKFNFCQY